MSYQCKNCEREKDQNNNYVNASYVANANGTRGNRSSLSTRSSKNATGGSGGGTNENLNGSGGGSSNGATGSQMTGATQVTAKVMWGSVGAIKELREKEQAERNQVTRAGRRQ